MKIYLYGYKYSKGNRWPIKYILSKKEVINYLFSVLDGKEIDLSKLPSTIIPLIVPDDFNNTDIKGDIRVMIRTLENGLWTCVENKEAIIGIGCSKEQAKLAFYKRNEKNIKLSWNTEYINHEK